MGCSTPAVVIVTTKFTLLLLSSPPPPLPPPSPPSSFLHPLPYVDDCVPATSKGDGSSTRHPFARLSCSLYRRSSSDSSQRNRNRIQRLNSLPVRLNPRQSITRPNLVSPRRRRRRLEGALAYASLTTKPPTHNTCSTSNRLPPSTQRPPASSSSFHPTHHRPPFQQRQRLRGTPPRRWQLPPFPQRHSWKQSWLLSSSSKQRRRQLMLTTMPLTELCVVLRPHPRRHLHRLTAKTMVPASSL